MKMTHIIHCYLPPAVVLAIILELFILPSLCVNPGY